jgi:glycosyltransferase involved in cell wall biosynthesis
MMSESQSGRPAGLRVAHVIDEGARGGGIGTFLSNLVRAQRADSDYGDIHLVCDPDQMDPLLSALPVAFHPYRSDRRPVAVIRTTRAIALHLREIQPDLVFLWSSFPGLWGRLISRRGWKTLYCAQGWAFEQNVSPLKKAVYRFVEWLLSRRTDAIVSPSRGEYVAGEAAGIQPRFHRMILHGVPACSQRYTPPPSVAGAPINLTFIGRFDRQKGLDILQEVFSDSRLDGITLSVFGRNVIGEGIEVSPRANLHLLGWLPHTSVDEAMQKTDALIVPSRWEGFGLVAIEAMRNGRAVLTSGAGGLGETVQDGVNGRIFDLRDVESIRNLLLDLKPAELERMGREGQRVFLENYEWSICFAQWQKLVRDIFRA